MVRRTILLTLLVLATGCRVRHDVQGGAIELSDDGGTITRLAGPATRVVSLVPAATELVFALGAGGRLVGRTKWCDFPAAAALVPSVGDGLQPNVEAVAAARPDLVLMYRSPSNTDATAKLRRLGVPVLELALDRFEDFERAARVVGAALGQPGVGDSLATAARAALEAATVPAADRPTVLVVVWSDPPMTIGGGSFLNEIIHRAGGRNVFADIAKPSFAVALEAVAARNPDRVLSVGEAMPAFANRPEWQVIDAVRARRFVTVTGSLFNRPSPRMAEAVAALGKALKASTP